MSDETPPQDQAASADEPSPIEEWKPEPRQWTWKDLFTAPQLAFKPKCMAIAAITAVLIALWWMVRDQIDIKDAAWLEHVFNGIWLVVTIVVGGLGATLIATFMKADLLDDEFLSFKEALGQFKGRLKSALLVPLFLIAVVIGFVLLIYVPMLIGSIPYVGPTLYAILYPLGYLLALFTVLICIAVVLSLFVFPAIIAIRKHGWFDNVIDTFEAVGTKPHVLVLNVILIFILMAVVQRIGFGSMDLMNSLSDETPGVHLEATEDRGREIRNDALRVISPSTYLDQFIGGLVPSYHHGGGKAAEVSGYYTWFTGLVTAGWQILIGALIIGYLWNIFIAGGMLTYLAVREDDYWDDEDLEDLDQLAKELEEEAKREEAAASDATAAAQATDDAGAVSETSETQAAPAVDESESVDEQADTKPAEEDADSSEAKSEDESTADEASEKSEESESDDSAKDDGADQDDEERPKKD